MPRRMTWLLVDDDSDDREIFLMSLKKINKQIDCDIAKDGAEALQKLRNYAVLPDCIVLDLNMPIMDGRECLSELKKDDKLKNIPVFIYSTSSDSKFKDELKSLGAAEYIVKPSGMSALNEIQNDLYYRLEALT